MFVLFSQLFLFLQLYPKTPPRVVLENSVSFFAVFTPRPQRLTPPLCSEISKLKVTPNIKRERSFWMPCSMGR